MKRALCVLIAALAAAGLAACDSRVLSEQPTPKQQTSAVPANPAAENLSAAKAAPGSTPAADTELSNKVKNVLTEANGVDIGAVQVAAADGVVTIHGTVEMPAERDRAALLALGVDGVRGVVNNLVAIRGS